MAVCITGMHRSGTSLVANLLARCGLFLGNDQDLLPPSVDNQRGYWEHANFVWLNDEVLSVSGGVWDCPPRTRQNYASGKFNHLRLQAARLVGRFYDREPWGWKDPRNCLTLNFWKNLGTLRLPFWYGKGPPLKVVLCLRNPFAVAASLAARKFTPNNAGLELWYFYNSMLVNSTSSEERLVTHYETYFSDARSELKRVLEFTNMKPTDEIIERAIREVSQQLRHYCPPASAHMNSSFDIEVLNLYRDLCAEAGFTNER